MQGQEEGEPGGRVSDLWRCMGQVLRAVVVAPDETHSVTLPWPGAGSLPVTDDSGSPVKIGPMGSAGQGG